MAELSSSKFSDSQSQDRHFMKRETSKMAELSSSEFSDSQSQDRLQEAAVNFIRRNVKLAYNSLNKKKDQSQEEKGARQLFNFSLDNGMKWLASNY